MRPTKITSNGATGFFLRGARGQKVRVVNGVMSPLLSARRADTLTAIYSQRLIQETCILVMFGKREPETFTFHAIQGKLRFARTGLVRLYCEQASVLSMTYPLHLARMGQVDMWRSTYLSKRCLRHTGLKGGKE